MATPKDFAIALLNRLGLEVTDNRLVGLVAFAAIEGGHWHNAARYNPMNTTRSIAGSRPWGGAIPIQVFPNWAAGIEATALTMAQGNMRAMLDSLRADEDPRSFLRAVTRTQWCPGCDYTPFNPYALYKARANESDQGEALTTTATSSKKWVAGVAAVILGVSAVYLLYTPTRRLLRRAAYEGAAENPVRRRGSSRRAGRGRSRVQTLLFDRRRFTPSQAKSWARGHGYRSGKVDVTDQYVRLRQADPGRFARMRTVTFGSGVKAVVGFPR